MNMKRWTMVMALLVAVSTGVSAQGFLKKLKDKAIEKVKEKVENKVERTVSDEMDDVLDGKSNKSSKKSQSSDADYEEAEAGDNTPDADTQNAKSDFVRGSVILFEDNMDVEQMGEFPSKWDVDEGNAEVASINGKKYMNFTTEYNYVKPLMKNMQSYLPDVFTLEWDMFLTQLLRCSFEFSC